VLAPALASMLASTVVAGRPDRGANKQERRFHHRLTGLKRSATVRKGSGGDGCGDEVVPSQCLEAAKML